VHGSVPPVTIHPGQPKGQFQSFLPGGAGVGAGIIKKNALYTWFMKCNDNGNVNCLTDIVKRFVGKLKSLFWLG